MEQDTIALLDIVRFETGNQRSDQLSELRGREGPRGILGIDEDGRILVVWRRATEGEGQQIGVDVLVEEGVDSAGHHGPGVPVPHDDGTGDE